VTNNNTLAQQAASPDLIHCAALGRFVCPPAQQAGPVPHVLAGDVISADFDHENGVQRHRHPLLARPAALAAGRPPREPSAPDQRLEQAADLGRIFVYPGSADVVQSPILIIEPQQK
jgi:hypothetical protein